jgi:hypothetical protein
MSEVTRLGLPAQAGAEACCQEMADAIYGLAIWRWRRVFGNFPNTIRVGGGGPAAAKDTNWFGADPLRLVASSRREPWVGSSPVPLKRRSTRSNYAAGDDDLRSLLTLPSVADPNFIMPRPSFLGFLPVSPALPRSIPRPLSIGPTTDSSPCLPPRVDSLSPLFP